MSLTAELGKRGLPARRRREETGPGPVDEREQPSAKKLIGQVSSTETLGRLPVLVGTQNLTPFRHLRCPPLVSIGYGPVPHRIWGPGRGPTYPSQRAKRHQDHLTLLTPVTRSFPTTAAASHSSEKQLKLRKNRKISKFVIDSQFSHKKKLLIHNSLIKKNVNDSQFSQCY